MYRGRLSFLRSLILFPFLFLNPGSVSDPDGAPLWQFNDCSLFIPIWCSSNFLPATEINMFGHASQMRKPRFCELVWTPAASQPTSGESGNWILLPKTGADSCWALGAHVTCQHPCFLPAQHSHTHFFCCCCCVWTQLCMKFNSFIDKSGQHDQIHSSLWANKLRICLFYQ